MAKNPEIQYQYGAPAKPVDKDSWKMDALGQVFGHAEEIINNNRDANLSKAKTTAMEGIDSTRKYLLENERVDINDPRLPKEVVDQIKGDLSSTDPDLEVVGDQVFLPSSRIMPQAMEHLTKQLNEFPESVDESRRDEYVDFVNTQLTDTNEKVQQEYRRQIINDTRQKVAQSVQTLVERGNINAALDEVDRAENTNIFDGKMAQDLKQGVIKVATERATTDLEKLSNEIDVAARNNMTGRVKDLEAEYQNRMTVYSKDKGLFSSTTANEMTKDAEMNAEVNRYRGELKTMMGEQGLPSVLANITAMKGTPPAGWKGSLQDWDDAVKVMQADANVMIANGNKVQAYFEDMQKGGASGILVNNMIKASQPAVTTDQRKASNSVYENSIAKLAAGAPDAWIQESIEYANSLQHVPTSMKDTMNAMSKSGPEQAANAARLYGSLSVNPHLNNQLTGESKAFLSMLSSRIATGMSPANAYDVVSKTIGADKTVTDMRNEQYTAVAGSPKKFAKRVNNVINESYDQSIIPFIPNAQQTAEFSADYRILEKDYFMLTGDLDEAQELASKDLAYMWDVSHVNGKPEFMRLPPEQVFGEFEGNTDWIGEQFDKYKLESLTDYIGSEGAENVTLEADWRTRNETNPSYPVIIKEGGVIPYQAKDMKTGRLLRYRPDVSKLDAYKENQEATKVEQQEKLSDMSTIRTMVEQSVAQLTKEGALDFEDEQLPAQRLSAMKSLNVLTDRAFQAAVESMRDDPLFKEEVEVGRSGRKTTRFDSEKFAKFKKEAAREKRLQIDTALDKYYAGKERTAPLKSKMKAPVVRDKRGRPTRSKTKSALEVIGG